MTIRLLSRRWFPEETGRSPGFTLIELLIVVAIIAILAAIAVPNFLEARTRALVSRVKADHRSLATSIESYHADWNRYPCDIYETSFGCPWYSNSFTLEDDLVPLSTPIAYCADALLLDPLNGRQGYLFYEGCDIFWDAVCADKAEREAIYGYIALPRDDILYRLIPLLTSFLPPSYQMTTEDIANVSVKRWVLNSAGPDTYYSFDRCMVDAAPGDELECVLEQVFDTFLDRRAGIYDPTNGTISRGELVRHGGGISYE